MDLLVPWGVFQKAQCDCFGGKISVSRVAREETDILRKQTDENRARDSLKIYLASQIQCEVTVTATVAHHSHRLYIEAVVKSRDMRHLVNLVPIVL